MHLLFSCHVKLGMKSYFQVSDSKQLKLEQTRSNVVQGKKNAKKVERKLKIIFRRSRVRFEEEGRKYRV